MVQVCGWQKMTYGLVFDLVLQETAIFGSVSVLQNLLQPPFFSSVFLHRVLFNVYAVY